MDKQQRRSVNFDEVVEVSEFEDEFDDEFDEDSDDAGTLQPPGDKQQESIELNNVEYKTKPKGYQISNDVYRSSLTRRGSLMLKGINRISLYKPPNTDDPCDSTLDNPIEPRVITDICCFMLFFVFVAIWAFSICLVFNLGNLERFAVPKGVTYKAKGASEPELCGGQGNEMYNYELNLNIFKCIGPMLAFKNCETNSICVEKCPTDSFSLPNIGSKVPPITALQCGRNKPILTNKSNMDAAIKQGLCAEVTTKSMILNGTAFKTIQHKCLPDLIGTEIDFIVDLVDVMVPQTNIPWRITYELTKRIDNKIMYKFSDMLHGWPVLLGLLVGGLILTLILIYSMKFIARFLFIITNLINFALLAISAYKCYEHGVSFEEFSLNIFKNHIWEISVIFTSIVLITVSLQFLCQRTATLIVLELIKETTNAIQYIKMLLVFPLIFGCVRIGAILFSMYIGFTIKSTNQTDFILTDIGSKYNRVSACNNYNHGGFCNPAVVRECLSTNLSCNVAPYNQKIHENLINFSQLTNLAGYFWAYEYLYLLEFAILASAFATYYWTFHKKDIPTFTLTNGIYISVRYHLGTIFFAWLFVSIYAYIRFEFQLLDGMLSLLPFSLIHFFFKYVMIVMALSGDDFYESAKEVIRLVRANARLIIISKLMSEILFFYVKLLITAIVGGLAYLIVLCVDLIQDGYFKNNLFPVYIVCIVTYIIATEIFNIYILGVDTFTICFIEDCTLNNGCNKSPFFMSRQLMHICHKKNTMDASIEI